MGAKLAKAPVIDLDLMPKTGAPTAPRPATTLAVTRGAQRLLRSDGRTSLTEVPLPSGRRADLMALGADGEIWIVEIKSSIEDFRADHKWPEYRAHCDKLFFAVDIALPSDCLPADTGLIVADAFGAAIIRDAPIHRLAGATRRSLLLQFARIAADRLHLSRDPEAGAASVS
jgi:hypothetical protein